MPNTWDDNIEDKVLLPILKIPSLFFHGNLILFIGRCFPVSIVVQPNAGICEGFTDSSGDRRRRSVVLAPVKVRVEGGGFTLSPSLRKYTKNSKKDS